MNGMPQEDRLSAYFDDQLSLEERAQFEKELAESASMRRELDELRQVSGLVRDLPIVSAPVELYSSVMRAIERDTLLPKEPVSGRRYGRLLVAAACAVAAVAVLVIQTQNGNQIAENSPRPSQSILERENPKGPQRAVHNRVQFEIKRSDLASAKVGDVIKAVSASGDAAIQLTVVDRQAGVADLRVLLAGEGQVQVQGAETEADNGLVAVYLKSDPIQMADVIKQLGETLDAAKDGSDSVATEIVKGVSARVIFVLVNDAKPAAKPAAKDASGAAD